MTELRPYQREALKAALTTDDPCVIQLPTGSGKTLVFSELTRHFRRTLILCHREELIDQAEKSIQAIYATNDELPRIGIIKYPRFETNEPITIASVPSFKQGRFRDDPEIIVIDECHHANAPTWRAVCNYFPKSKIVGFTATYRHTDDSVFKTVAYRRDILDMINDGYLVDPIGYQITVDGFSLDEAKRSHGDFTSASLSQLLSSTDAQRVTAETYVEKASDRQGLVFVPSISAVDDFVQTFNEHGIVTSAITGAMPSHLRREVIRRFRKGEIQVLVNCAVLTEGFDAPEASCVVIARPTLSDILYQQMVGRVLRPAPGKPNALVLDVAGACERHSLAGLADLTSQRVPDIAPGESLLQAAQRAVAARVPALRSYVIQSEQIDLFGMRQIKWLQTKMGVWFIPTVDQIIFLWPEESGKYSVGIRSKNRQGGDFLITGAEFEIALQTAEQTAHREHGYKYGIGSKAAWRKKPPSENMIALAKRKRIAIHDGMKAGDISTAIDVKIASDLLDRALG